jgi:hypothetical protein
MARSQDYQRCKLSDTCNAEMQKEGSDSLSSSKRSRATREQRRVVAHGRKCEMEEGFRGKTRVGPDLHQVRPITLSQETDSRVLLEVTRRPFATALDFQAVGRHHFHNTVFMVTRHPPVPSHPRSGDLGPRARSPLGEDARAQLIRRVGFGLNGW